MSAASPPGRHTVLVTEDEKLVRDLVGTVLQSQGYQVLLATDGQDALRICQEHSGAIDLLLTDMVMPGISGSELAQAMIRLRPELKVLYMSGYTEYAVVNQGVMERVQSFIWKPFTNAALLEKVRQVLDGTQQE
jgi:two-component system cell cycle sensor histidine kinase/response regulator CckA